MIADHHSGYISWEEFVQNQQQLDANAMCDGEGERRCQSRCCVVVRPAALRAVRKETAGGLQRQQRPRAAVYLSW